MTDISTIMVEAAEAGRDKYRIQSSDDFRNSEVVDYENDDKVLFTGARNLCLREIQRLVVQAQLRALHAAGFRVIHETVQHEYGIPDLLEELALKPWVYSAALRENG